MGLFDNWSWENLGKNLNPMDSTLGSFWKGDYGKTGSDLMGALQQGAELSGKTGELFINPVGTLNKMTGNPDLDVQGKLARDMAERQKWQGIDAQRQQNDAAWGEQAQKDKAQKDKEARYKGTGFLQALEADYPGMFKPIENSGAAAWGAPKKKTQGF